APPPKRSSRCRAGSTASEAAGEAPRTLIPRRLAARRRSSEHGGSAAGPLYASGDAPSQGPAAAPPVSRLLSPSASSGGHPHFLALSLTAGPHPRPPKRAE